MTDKPPIDRYARIGLYFTVSLTGASVMVIELLGTRIIAPFYGVSLYVWSSLISVTMIALALGYFVGGRWADRPNGNGLSLIIGLAGLMTLLIPWVSRPVLLATDPLGLRGGAFVSALVLFMPSLTLLGMVGPAAVKLATSGLDGVGSSTGSIYAVSTVGSVAGTLVLGLFLFPLVGSRQILAGLGVVLFALALGVGLCEPVRRGGRGRILAINVGVAILGLSLLPGIVGAGHVQPGGDDLRILSESESLYGWVRVIDQPAKNVRLLTADASVIGAAGISHGESLLSYQDIVSLIPALRPQMNRALIVGLGAGHMVKLLDERYGLTTDALEIDPAVAKAATDYFGFRPSGRLIVGDARHAIRHLSGRYDLIIHDCFTGGSEPAHLLTVETLAQLRGLLTEDGILAINLVAFAQGPQAAVLSAVARTIERVLPHQAVFISEPGKDFNDFIFLAARRPLAIDSPKLTPGQVRWLRDRVYPVDKSQGVILTDDFNPLDSLQTAKAEYYRHFLVERFGAGLFLR